MIKLTSNISIIGKEEALLLIGGKATSTGMSYADIKDTLNYKTKSALKKALRAVPSNNPLLVEAVFHGAVRGNLFFNKKTINRLNASLNNYTPFTFLDSAGHLGFGVQKNDEPSTVVIATSKEDIAEKTLMGWYSARTRPIDKLWNRLRGYLLAVLAAGELLNETVESGDSQSPILFRVVLQVQGRCISFTEDFRKHAEDEVARFELLDEVTAQEYASWKEVIGESAV